MTGGRLMFATKLQHRMAWAQRAVQYVESDCAVSSSNRGWGEWLGGVVTLRGLRLAAQRAGYPDLPGIQLVEVAGNTARTTQLGNCYEKSALAFLFLRANARQVGPINWCSVSGHATGHGIVILGTLQGFCTDSTGRPDGVKSRPDGGWGVQNTMPTTWPRNAVVCDPWKRVAYPVTDWDKYERGHYVEVCATQ